MARVPGRLMAAGLALCFCSTPACAAANEAEETAPPALETTDISGNWLFETAEYRDGFCQMSGTMTVFTKSDPESGALSCSLNAVEVCGGDRSIAEQDCKITATEDGLLVESSILNLLEKKPWSTGYAPDNFVLDEISSTRMTGRLVSAITAPALFYRPVGGIS